MAKALKAAGVTAFSGRIIADESKFDDARLADGWGWDNEPFDYQPQISALTCDENVIAVQIRPGANPGDPAEIVLGGDKAQTLGFTGTNYVLVRNAVITIAQDAKKVAKPATPLSFDRARAQNLILISGEIRVGANPITEAITVEDPALFTANRLWELLPVAGIAVPTPDARRTGKGIVPADAVTLAAHQSETLANLLPAFLKPSDNLYGECFLKTLGAEKAGKGTWDDGAKVIKTFLMDAKISVAGLYLRDGSGLTRKDNVAPRTFVELLTFIDRKLPPAQRKTFYDALPIGGKEDDYVNGLPSTLRLRYRGTPLAGHVRAKTGSLDGVSGLSGYVTTPSGKRYVFSLLMNHFSSGGPTSQVRAAQDAVILSLP
jgi:D-alanyl-D-alanine carboxypeptidase/D-alanyl-D-alanine-endopeptidase (penicillin-binding protein 4)